LSKRKAGSKPAPRLTDKLLMISSKAGSITPEIEAQLRKAFAGYTIVDFDPKEDFRRLLKPRARVVVAGGDGTKTGVPYKITIGRVGGTPFLEAAAIGMFGAAIELGEAVKDRHFGELGRKVLPPRS